MGTRVLACSGLAGVLIECAMGAGCGSPSKPTALAVSAIAPSVGATSGATKVTISGIGFQTGATVSFGGTVTSANLASASQIVAEAPAHAAGTVDVVVTNPDGQSSRLTASYTYAVEVPAALTLTSVVPTRGSSAGGTVVRLNGTGFFDAMVATVDGTIVHGLVVISPTSAELAMPPHARGPVAIAVASPSGHLSWLAGAYEYNDPLPLPVVTDVWPTTVSTQGAPLRIKGTGFTGGTDVTIDGVALPTFFYEGTLYTEAPPHAAGVVDVVVTNPDGQAVRWSGALTYAPPEFFDFNGTWEGGSANRIRPFGSPSRTTSW